MEFIFEPEFWVAVSFFIFVGLVLYLGVHKKIAAALDNRAAQIKKELEEARRLREEAERVLADYKRKEGDAAKEAQEIISLAGKEAEMLAEDKIARAEAEALREVRNAAADAAVIASQTLIAKGLKPETADKLVKEG